MTERFSQLETERLILRQIKLNDDYRFEIKGLIK